ncbi:MAG: bifunctional 5,10-methylenetetrahydrofolate dehydrogenase/5,10-methenyltetrahydrofolate cyclohydrolase [Elusimicrobiota bacterium]
MPAKIIDGNLIAEKIKSELKSELGTLKLKTGKPPVLAAVQVGENPASKVYIRNQKQYCEETGIEYHLVQTDENVGEEKIQDEISKLNSDEDVTGIILQMPLPQSVNPKKLQMQIASSKDVEGITPPNLGMLVYSEISPVVAPCTALSVIECIKSTEVEIKGKETVIVGHSEIVGKPVTLMLLSSLLSSATPTVCHIATKDLKTHTGRADILIVAVGKPGLIRGDMVKEGAIIIDVGINRIPLLDEKGNKVIDEKTGKPKFKTVGDVAFDEVLPKASFITPVPGGVGAVTTVMLIKNLLNLWKMQLGESGITHKIL